MWAAVVQLNSGDDVASNLARVRHWTSQAARAGAHLVTLPENFAYMGDEAGKLRAAERLDGSSFGPIVTALIDIARASRLWIVGGGMPEQSSDPRRPFNTSVLLDPSGAI